MTPAHAHDAERIAAGLSEAQRRAVLWLPSDGARQYPREDTPSAIYHEMHPLEDRGLADQEGWQWRLTPVGLAVRAILAKEPA